MRNTTLALLGLLVVSGLGYLAVAVAVPGEGERRGEAVKAMEAGNFKEAYDAFRALALDPGSDATKAGDDLHRAVDCLQRLGRTDEVDRLREEVVAAHKDHWRVLWAAAQSHQRTENWGFVVVGEFLRGGHRGGDGRQVSAIERDRVRALQLMVRAMPLADAEPQKADVGEFYFSLAEMLLDSRYGDGAWRLQYLTDLAALPDYDDMTGFYRRGGNDRGAPVNEDGSPVFHKLPKSWEAAATDGERWRWCLMQAAEFNPAVALRARWTFAQFLQSQFDVTTMIGRGYFPVPHAAEGDEDAAAEETGPFAVSTLGEDETIARLAGGTKRFTLPDEFNFIKIYREIAQAKGDYADSAYDTLAQAFEDRQQYPRAAEVWRQAIAAVGPGHEAYRQRRLDQVVNPWGMFEGARPAAAGGPAPKLQYLFRNGKRVTFRAWALDVPRLLGDVKAYLKRNPGQLDWEQLQVENIGHRLVVRGEDQYRGEQVAAWEMELTPRAKHFDRRVVVTPPMKAPGAYLVTASMHDGGNESRVVMWVADTALVKKQLDRGSYYFVADAAGGAPVGGAKLEFFGFRQRHLGDNRWATDTREFAEQADADGQVRVTPEQEVNQFQWLVTATAGGRDGQPGRFAYHGYAGIWGPSARDHDRAYNERKVFAITDRPVYRPGQTVKFKFWIGQAKYDAEGESPYAYQPFDVVVHNPKGDKVLEKRCLSDPYGGFDGELALEDEATLGVYGIQVLNMGGGSFRVEEYKKPEFEVTVDAPTEPVMLGEKITATINSKYYFGAPVTDAKVKYKVMRTRHTAQWFPSRPWDWFYGKGYWWFGRDYLWYPGFREWGCFAPRGWWWGAQPDQPEVVSENEVPVGADGTVKVEIDTALAKAVHGDDDHRYEITAEVTDQSRRTITGTGTVSVARKPFKVYTWVDRGYYNAGDVVEAQFSARTLDDEPVTGSAVARLMRVTYGADMKPVEEEVERWAVEAKSLDTERRQIKAAEPGQYRLSVTVTDEKKHAIEGGYVFVVRDAGFGGEAFRFNDVEVIADKAEYRAGDTVRLMVNTARADSTVVLFVRPTDGIYLPPTVIRLNGKSTVREIGVVKRDMPNFFVEALTVADGRVFSETKELVVPPENRVVNVQVLPGGERYKPGQKAKVRVKLTDANGEPVVGSAVVSVYDKSVEYVSGGSNVPEIKEFFWKWRRQHHPRTETNLDRFDNQVLRPGEIPFGYLGRFGHMVSDLALGDADVMVTLEAETNEGAMPARKPGAFGGGGGGGGQLRGLAAVTAMAPEAAAGPMETRATLRRADGLRDEAGEDKSGGGQPPGPGGGGAYLEPTVRKNFADTALWVADLDVPKNGIAEFELDMPENLTTWKTKVWVMGEGTRVGEGSAEVVTAKDLIVRLQAPRFFVQSDEVVLSANVHNYLKTAKDVKVTLELNADLFEALEEPAERSKRNPGGNTLAMTRVVHVAATGEQRVDWRVKVTQPGRATVRMLAQTDEESDATEMSFPVCVHGMLKTDSFAGAIRPGVNSAAITFAIPDKRLPEQTRVEVRYSPSVASAMVDALPYLVDFPYGCTEQTLNRFVPTVVTQRVLIGMGLDLKDVRDKRTNLNAQEVGDDAKRAADWKRNNPPNPGAAERNPVFDEAVVAEMVRAGVTKLADQQLGDGGWGWFSGFGEQSWPHTTATVVHGLQVARDNDAALPAGVLERGVEWLSRYEAAQVQMLKNAPGQVNPWKDKADNLDAFVFMVLSDEQRPNAEMREFLYRDRTDLSVYCLAQFGLALANQEGQGDKLAMVLRNLRQYVVEDDENQTAYLRLPEGTYWWHWYGTDTEANAYYLKLLAKTDGKGELAARLAKYLINNRKHASYWNSTRDTALCVEALADFIRASGEDKPDMTVVVSVDGKEAKRVKIDASNFFSFDNQLVLEGAGVEPGEHRIGFTRTGTGPLYFNAYVTNFTLEDPIRKAGLEIKVRRRFYRLVPVEKQVKVSGSRGQALDQKVEAFKREPLKEGDALTSGDVVEAELEIDSKNDYEYVIFEDMKASGFEPVETQSGYNGNDLNAYMELRDERVAFFARTLARGKHSVAYKLRAEIPGKFSALPTRAWAMYAPELRANSDEDKLNIVDAAEPEAPAARFE
jgi:uncharacterized protein YfaS (alpha-2-macroglobulin family)